MSCTSYLNSLKTKRMYCQRTDTFHRTRLTIKHSSVSLGVTARAEKILNVKVTEGHVLQYGRLSSYDDVIRVVIRCFLKYPYNCRNLEIRERFWH